MLAGRSDFRAPVTAADVAFLRWQYTQQHVFIQRANDVCFFLPLFAEVLSQHVGAMKLRCVRAHASPCDMQRGCWAIPPSSNSLHKIGYDNTPTGRKSAFSFVRRGVMQRRKDNLCFPRHQPQRNPATLCPSTTHGSPRACATASG